MAQISSIRLDGFRDFRDFDISLEKDGEFRHLIITGPNASGKTTLLDHLRHSHQTKRQGVIVRWSESPVPGPWHFGARRHTAFQTPTGPKKIKFRHSGSKSPDYSGVFVQFLINKRYELLQALATEDEGTSREIQDWFGTLQRHLGAIFDDGGFKLEFGRSGLEVQGVLGSGFKFDLTDLADGHHAALEIFANLLTTLESSDRIFGIDRLKGTALIDELELHLHIELQEKLLPFLTDTFS